MDGVDIIPWTTSIIKVEQNELKQFKFYLYWLSCHKIKIIWLKMCAISRKHTLFFRSVFVCVLHKQFVFFRIDSLRLIWTFLNVTFRNIFRLRVEKNVFKIIDAICHLIQLFVASIRKYVQFSFLIEWTSFESIDRFYITKVSILQGEMCYLHSIKNRNDSGWIDDNDNNDNDKLIYRSWICCYYYFRKNITSQHSAKNKRNENNIVQWSLVSIMYMFIFSFRIHSYCIQWNYIMHKF